MLRLPFELMLALRYLRPKRTFVSVITVISVLGVMVGVAVLIIVISVMSGFDRELRERVLGFNAHLKVYASGEPLRDYRAVMAIVASNRNVRGVAPFVMGQVLIETEPEHGDSAVAGAWVRGVDPATEGRVSTLPSSVKRGAFDVSGDGLLVGVDLADALHLDVGDRVAVYGPKDFQQIRKAQRNGTEEVVVPADFEVHGIFDAGYFEYNSAVIVMSLQNAQELYGLDRDDSVHGLLVVLNDPYRANAVRAELEQVLGPRYEVKTWMEENAAMVAVMVEKNVMLYILFFIVIVAAFGITCTLITFVVQKTREIGVLKALGATSRQVMWIFLGQSLIVSLMGVVLGLGAALLALAYRNNFLHLMNRWTGFELLPPSIYGFNELPALIVPGDLAVICGGSLLICVLAAAFPAWHASRLKPVEALRYE